MFDPVFYFDPEAPLAPSPYDGFVGRAGEERFAAAAASLRGVEKHFDDSRVLRGIDLDIRAGEFVAVVGQSGSGKSTLLRLLAGLDEPTAGRIVISGSTARQVAQVRLMFQEPRLLPWARVVENVEIGLHGVADDKRRQRAKNALTRVGLAARAGDWPGILSGGQKQRVALARALVSRPRLLALDEPLGALDALTRLGMQQLIEEVWRTEGFTAVLVTHDVTEAVMLADRVVVLEDGRIVDDIAVDLPRPRHPAAPGASEIETRILDRLLRPAGG
jgi:sulfonate transport system ATP-binding protein